jgi:D-3-phosphoglycerate dehydrogenase / 2-oxoglutarate reductase
LDLLITEEIADPSIDQLRERYRVVADPELWRNRPALLDRAREARALLVRNMTLVDRELLDHAPRLEVVGRLGVGLDNLDLAALEERGVVVCYPPGENAVAVSEHVFALLLALARNVIPADRCVREGRWERTCFVGFELAGKTLSILGLGRIGFRVAVRARAFGMQVLAHDPYLTPQHPFVTESGAELVSLEQALREADVITCHVPLTEETRGLLNADRLRWLKPSAVVVNTSRGPVVEEEALVSALQEGRLAGACLDVRSQEPPVAGPLHTLPNVVLAPHIAGWSREALGRVVRTVCDDVDRVLRGEAALQAVHLTRPRKTIGPSR